MKKFFRFLIVLIIIVGGCAGYFFLANNKMMVSVLKADKDALSTTLNNSIKKVHGYGNFNFSYKSENKTTKTKQTSQVLIKFDGEKRYFSAEVTEIVGDKTTNCSYYCEATGDVATIYKTSGEEKTQYKRTWDLAVAEVINVRIANVILQNDYAIAKEDFTKAFKSSKVTFSFKPFYYGATIELEDHANMKYDISNRGILRKIDSHEVTLGVEVNRTLIVNKPGKAVSINAISEKETNDFKPVA